MKRLFFVVNPTQYLNAVEYANYCGDGENHMALMTRYSASIEAINKLGAKVFWRTVETLNVPLKHEIHSDKDLWTLIREFMEVKLKEINPDELVIGNIGDSCMYPFSVRFQRRFSRITFLDDGTPSLYVSTQRATGKFKNNWHLRSKTFILKNLLYNKVFLITALPPKSLRFFSVFQISTIQSDVRIANNYNWLKSKMSNTDVLASQAYFIGSHIVDRNLIDRKTYMKSLVEAKRFLEDSGLEFHYVHHRGESKEIREEIQEHYSTKEFDLPLELVFLNQNRPQVFSGHFSSALFNLSRIYQEQHLKAFLFPKGVLKGTFHEPIEYLESTMKAVFEDKLIESHVLDFR